LVCGGDRRLGNNLRKAIEDAEAVYLSVVSVWEATIKYHIGKLPLPEPPHPWLSEQRVKHGIESLSIDEASVAHLQKLEAHHRDPYEDEFGVAITDAAAAKMRTPRDVIDYVAARVNGITRDEIAERVRRITIEQLGDVAYAEDKLFVQDMGVS
jgi:PIN domain nuclease of toxin-antitoxin system